jgi:hypothetical protein
MLTLAISCFSRGKHGEGMGNFPLVAQFKQSESVSRQDVDLNNASYTETAWRRGRRHIGKH